MYRGNTKAFCVWRCKDGEMVPFEEGDKVTLSIRESENTDEILWEQTADGFDEQGRALLSLLPKDTEGWPCMGYHCSVHYSGRNGDECTLLSVPLEVRHE